MDRKIRRRIRRVKTKLLSGMPHSLEMNPTDEQEAEQMSYVSSNLKLLKHLPKIRRRLERILSQPRK